MGLIFGAFTLLTGDESAREALRTVEATYGHLAVLYFLAMLLSASAAETRYTDRPESAWIYGIVPVASPGELH